MQPRRVGRLAGAGQRRHRPDYILVLISVALLTLGLIIVYSISPALGARHEVSEYYFVGRQLAAIGIGFVAFLTVAHIPLENWRKYRKPLLVIAIAATIITFISPVSPDYPAHRWIRIGAFSFQSVEIVKFAVIVWLAAFLSDRIKDSTLGSFDKTFKPILIGLAIVGGTVAIAQSDLGSAAVIGVIVASMAFVAGIPWKRIFQISAIFVLGLALLILPFGYRQDRVATFLNPEQDCQGTGYQACQAFIAVGSGGMFGRGLASSGQAYGYLPEAANDSIFAIVAEKFGFIGASLVVVLFGAFITRIKNIAERAPNEYTRLLVVGVLSWLSVQAFINIGAMIGLFPLKGITLPLISYGGTSVVFVLAAIGLVFNVSRYTSYTVNRGDIKDEDTAFRGRNTRPYYASPSRRS